MEHRTDGYYGKIIAPGVIRFERLLPGPIEQVWAFLTDPSKRALWLAAGETELITGGKVVFHFRHQDLSDEKTATPEKYKFMENGHSFSGRVLAVDPPHLLRYTWGEEMPEVSEVTFELTPKGDKVLLTLTHRKLSKDMMVSVASGWHTHLGILSDRLEGIPPKNFWRVHEQMENIYTKKIEN